MPDNPEYLLELIDKAQAIAVKEQQSAAALFLNMAADAALRPEVNGGGAEAKPVRRRRKWRWTPSRGLNA
ncbi:MAG: hypothetical protein AB1508_04155 [Pseudomonadota bacterium]